MRLSPPTISPVTLARLLGALVLIGATFSVHGSESGVAEIGDPGSQWDTLLREGRLDEAVATLRRRADQPDADQAIPALARLYEQVGEIESAIEMYQRAVVIPDLPRHQAVELSYRLDHCKRQRASLVRFPYSVEALTEIRQVDALLQTRQWHAAFNTMAGILERFEGQFLQQATGESQGLWGWAGQKLATLPEEGIAAFEDWSRPAWEAALQDAGEVAIRAFLTTHPVRKVSGKAFLTWANILADQGEFERAAGLLSRSDLEVRAPEQWINHWKRWQSPATPSAGKVADELSAGELTSRLLDTSKGFAIPNLPGEDPDHFGWASDAQHLFLARHFRVEAYDLEAGDPLWTYTFDRGGDRYLTRKDNYDYDRMPRHKWTGAIDRPGIVLSPAGLLVVHAHDFGDPARVFRTLSCLDPATGNPVWQLEREPFFERLRVCSDPVYSAGKVLLVASSRGRFPSYWLIALDGRDGRLLWRHHIAIGATPTNCLGRGVLYAGQSGPTVTLDGETVYYTTHMGAVVAVDRDLGQPIWAVSYPRIARYGPMRRGPLPLLDRRTEPILMTSKYLVLLPRDLNGVLVIDRHEGKIATILRSLDLLELIDATDEYVIVRTLAGEVRRLRIADGREQWRWRPASDSASSTGSEPIDDDPHGESRSRRPSLSRPARIEDNLLVAHGTSLTTLDVATGKAQSVTAPEGLQFHRSAPGGHWLAMTPQAIRVVTAPDAESPRAQPDTFIADGQQPGEGNWSHEVYVPGLNVRGRLVASTAGAILLVADQTGLSAFRLAADEDASSRPARLWRRDFLSEKACWGVSFGSTLSYRQLHRVEPQPDARPAEIVAFCEDGLTVRILDITTGDQRAVGRIEGVAPIQRLHVVGDRVLVESFAQLAWVQARHDGSLATLWQRDFGPAIFEDVYPGDPETLVFIQGMDYVAATIIRLRHDDMDQPVAAEFHLPSPDLSVRVFDEENRPERYPVHRLSYTQDEVRRQTDGLTMTRDGKTFDLSGMAMTLLSLLDRYPDHVLLELGEYRALVDLTDGRVTLVSPFVEDNEHLRNKTPREDMLFQWYQERCVRHGCKPEWRHLDQAPFYFHNPNFHPLHYVYCAMAGQNVRPKCAVLKPRDSEAMIELGHPSSDGLHGDRVQPHRIDQVGNRWMVSSTTGALVIRQHDGPIDRTTPGKPARDLMTAPPVNLLMNITPVLDGDLSDWPDEGWQHLHPSRHAWPPSRAGNDAIDSPPQASFAVAMDDDALWVAVRVEDQHHVVPSAAPALMGDQVEILITRRLGLLRNPAWPREAPVPLVITLSLADHFPIARCRAPHYPTTLAQPVGAGGLFTEWFRRRYGHVPQMDEHVMVAGRCEKNTTVFEVRIDRSLFVDNNPGEFDLRVGNNDGNGLDTWLDWAGALNRNRVYPVAHYAVQRAEVEPDRTSE